MTIALDGGRHTSDHASIRADMQDRQRGDDLPLGPSILETRRRNPVRVSAGICGSCDGCIDANNGECRCS